MNPHDSNGFRTKLIPEANYAFGRLFATLLFGVCCAAVGLMVGEQRGYLEGRADCPKPQVKKLSEMSHKQQVKVIQWQMRDKGVIK